MGARSGIALAVAALTFGGLPTAARAEPGVLTQLPGAAGCVSALRDPGCIQVRALEDPGSPSMTADGRSLYVGRLDGVVALERDPASGALGAVTGRSGCVAAYGAPRCARARGMGGEDFAVAASPDGRNVYAVGSSSGNPFRAGIAVFSRSELTGGLTQLRGTAGCVRSRRTRRCAWARGLEAAASIAVSPDGRNVYVGGFFSVLVFARDLSTGALRQLDGERGCVVPRRLRTRAAAQHCAKVQALGDAPTPVVSPDGRNVYAAGGGFIGVFARGADGALAETGCLEYYGRRKCAKARGIWVAGSIALSPDGTSAYVGSGFGVAVLQRRVDGSLEQLPGTDGCITSDAEEAASETCSRVRGVDAYPAPVAAPDGRHVYVPSSVCVEPDPIADLCNTSSALIASYAHAPGGALTQLTGAGGCLAGSARLMRRHGCAHAHGFRGADALRDPTGTVSPDSRNLYTAIPGADTMLAFAIE